MNTERVNRLRGFKFSCNKECKDYKGCVIREIVEGVINDISDSPNTTNVYLQGFEDGYAQALEKIAIKIVETSKGKFGEEAGLWFRKCGKE